MYVSETLYTKARRVKAFPGMPCAYSFADINLKEVISELGISSTKHLWDLIYGYRKPSEELRIRIEALAYQLDVERELFEIECRNNRTGGTNNV